MFDRYVTEKRKNIPEDTEYVKLVEHIARFCPRDYIALSYLPFRQYDYMKRRRLEWRYQRTYSYLWKEYDIFKVTDVFRRFTECMMFDDTCCKNRLPPRNCPYILNCGIHIKRAFLKNEITDEYDMVLPEDWMNEAFRETEYRWSHTEAICAKKDYSFKTYLTSKALFVVHDETERLDSLRVITCEHCNMMMDLLFD